MALVMGILLSVAFFGSLVHSPAASASSPAPSAAPTSAASAGASTIAPLTKAGIDVGTGSRADASTSGTAAPGDTLKWAITSRGAAGESQSVDIHDPITAGQTYVAGTLQVPPGWQQQYSDDHGSTWADATPPPSANGVGAHSEASSPAGATSDPFVVNQIDFHTPGGDGYSVEGYLDRVYTVYHHSSGDVVFCATLSNQVCPGWPAQHVYVGIGVGTPVSVGTTPEWASANVNGSFIVGNELHWPVELTHADATGSYAVGMMCLNLDTNTSCGFTQLGTVSTAPGTTYPRPTAGLGGDGIAATNGNRYYLDLNGTMHCLTPTASTCGAFDVTPTGAPTPGWAWMQSDTYGQFVFFEYKPAGSGAFSLGCFDTSTKQACAAFGTPITLAKGFQSLAPLVSPSGTVTGVCATLDSQCFTSAGASSSVYPQGHNYGAAGFETGQLLGTRYYTADGNVVRCYDFSVPLQGGAVQQCAGFTPPADNADYTSRSLANLPGCAAADGDAGDIKVFALKTGASCLAATQSLQVSPQSAPSYCDGAKHTWTWDALTLQGLTGNEYATANVTLLGANGPVAGFSNVTLGAGATSLDISAVPAGGATAGLTATVAFTGVTDSAAVSNATFSLTRTGDAYSQICFQTRVNPAACGSSASEVSNQATATIKTGASVATATTGAVSFQIAAGAACASPLAPTTTPPVPGPSPSATLPPAPRPHPKHAHHTPTVPFVHVPAGIVDARAHAMAAHSPMLPVMPLVWLGMVLAALAAGAWSLRFTRIGSRVSPRRGSHDRR